MTGQEQGDLLIQVTG